MKKFTRYLIYAASVLVLTCALYVYRTLELGRLDAQSVIFEILNPAGEMVGPDGIAFDAAGNLYAGDAQGIVWEMEQGGSPRVYARMTGVQPGPGIPPEGGLIRVGGIAFDGRGNLYATCSGYGGSVILVQAGTKEIRLFARDVGVANHLVLSRDSKSLWVSDFRSQGRVLRYPLGGALPARPDVVIAGLDHPNGLAFGKDEMALYVAETYSGNIARIDILRDKPFAERIINLRGSFATGSLDSLAFDPRDAERRFLYVAENIRGLFTVVDLGSRPPRTIKSYRMALMGGRPCPASMVIRNGYLYFTDLWACSPLRILLGFPQWHTHAYRFRVLDFSSLYASETPVGRNP